MFKMYIILIKNISFQNWFVVELFWSKYHPPAPARKKVFAPARTRPRKKICHPPTPARTQHRPPDARPGCPPVLHPWSKLSNFESKNSIGDSVIVLVSILHIEEDKNTKQRSFWPILAPKHFFEKTLKISAPNSFFQNEPKFFYLILDFSIKDRP